MTNRLHEKYLTLPDHYDDELHESYHEIRDQSFNDTFNQMYHWIAHHFELSELKDICKHGMVSGFGNLIYYKDTCEFYDKFNDEIWQLINDEMEDQGETKNPFIFLSWLNGGENVGSDHQFKNLLCWYAVEHVARLFTEEYDA